MDYEKLTAPCGLDCFNCNFFLAPEDEDAMQAVVRVSEQLGIPAEKMFCSGCRAHDGRIPLQLLRFGDRHRCSAYECSKAQGLLLCGHCLEFPCDHLRPCADKADVIPHNIKAFNLCVIDSIGLEQWAKTRAADIRRDYFNETTSLNKS